MATIRQIKKDGRLPDYYYVMPNEDRIDIMVTRTKSGNQYTCVLPAPHFSKTFDKMREMRAYFDEHFES